MNLTLSLSAKPEHNGKRGVVVGFQGSADGLRVQVCILDQGGTELALKPANLVRATEANPRVEVEPEGAPEEQKQGRATLAGKFAELQVSSYP